MKTPRANPPKLFLRFFRWYCHPGVQDYIEGDLMEVYGRRVRRSGKAIADLRFMIDVLQLFRPGIIRSIRINNFNHSAMLKSYFTIGWRNLIRNKGYTFTNIAGLALSMTCAILIFTLVRHHLQFDNFHANADRIYRIVTELHRDEIAYRNSVPSPLGSFIRSEHTFAEKLARIYTEPDVLITLRKGDDVIKFEEVDGVAFTEPEFFEIFNFPLLQGNKATSLIQPNTAIITATIARKYFGDKDPIGETFWLKNKTPFTVTGVLKDLPVNTDSKPGIFVSYPTLKAVEPWLADDTDGWGGIRDGMRCFILLRPGIKTTDVEQMMAPYVKRFRPTSKNVHHYKLQPLSDVHFNGSYGGAMEKRNLWILSVVGLFLIITACVNFINLATAQALKRSKEVGVRKVLGGLRSQLFWQFMVETGIITFVGIALATVVAYMLHPSINLMFDIRLSVDLLSDPALLFFVVGLGIAITLFAGYYPGLVLAGFKPVAALKGRSLPQRAGGFNTRRVLIVTQFAISQVLIIGMIVVMSQLQFARQSDLGFAKDAIVMVEKGNDANLAVMNTMKDEIARIPGVEKVSLCFTAPASYDSWGNSIKFDNASEEVNFRTSIKSADADYVELFDLELVAGRDLSPSDTVREMLVNETLVRKVGLQSPEDALGRMIVADGGSMKAPIVGVVKDFHDQSFHEDITPVLLTTFSEDYSNYAIKLNLANAHDALAAIEKVWVSQHPDELFRLQFLDDSIARFYRAEETMLKLIQIFSFIAIFIGCLGLFGLVSFMTAQKTREVGIRKILGGSLEHILWIFSKEFLRLILIAFLIAGPVGWWLMSTWLQEFKFQIEMGAWIFALTIGSTLFIAAVTISYQVTKTALMNPIQSLRTE